MRKHTPHQGKGHLAQPHSTRLQVLCLVVLLAPLIALTAQAEYHKEQVRAEPAPFDLGPWVSYPSPGSAFVRWHTKAASSSVVSFSTGDAPFVTVSNETSTTEHEVLLTGLEPRTVYAYRIPAEGQAGVVNEYLLDTTFNYAPIPVPVQAQPYGPETEAIARQAAQLIEATGETQGYALLFGNPGLGLELARATSMTVTVFEPDAAKVQEARKLLSGTGVYGTRITVRSIAPDAGTGLTAHFANLVVWSPECGTPLKEAHRITRPGSSLVVAGARKAEVEALAAALPVPLSFEERDAADGVWTLARKATLPDAGEWTHQYGDASNASYSGDTLAGAQSTEDMEIQWLGRPGADFGIDRNPRMPSPLAVGGRLFHQGLNRMVAVDAYNGTILWLLEMPGLRRVNIPRDASNWCADEQYVYAAIRDRLWKLDAATGELVAALRLPASEPHEWGYTARVGGQLFATQAKPGSSYSEFWGKNAWYDGTEGEGTWKVCSEAFHALDPISGKPAWEYRKGKIINTTISIGDGAVYFVESRHPALAQAPTSRIEQPELWLEQYLVALDAGTGALKWERPLDTQDGVVIFFMAYANNTLVINTSLNKTYYLYGFDAATGETLWEANHPWPGEDHGGHMQHQAIARDTVFVEPHGYALRTGAVTFAKTGEREGCATVAATKNALIYRGNSRRVAMWGMDSLADSTWVNLRPSCWLSVVPANGMIMAPEGGGGCSCGGWVETSLGFIPRASLQ